MSTSRQGIQMRIFDSSFHIAIIFNGYVQRLEAVDLFVGGGLVTIGDALCHVVGASHRTVRVTFVYQRQEAVQGAIEARNSEKLNNT